MSGDLDLRKLRYFVAVAEHLNFGRAAQELHIAQPVLSRQIRALEDDLKARLFDRTRRATTLTPAGQRLLEDARPLLAAARAARRRVTGDPLVLTVGFMPGLIVTPAVRAFGRRHPEVTVELLRTSWDDQVAVIHDGRVDLGFVRLPIDERGLEVRPLLEEPRVAVLPRDHPLAGKERVTLADLEAEPLLQAPSVVPEWHGRRPRELPPQRSVEEKLEHVAAHHGIIILPLSVTTFYTRPDVTHVPVDGLAPNRVALAWPATRRTPLLLDFAEAALTACDPGSPGQGSRAP
ncbi:LysR family transcriptional regulator [Nonomuraea sp. NPDC050536]|uniref:LysR family transcriptional regulator n=1 Tax=Nonomuraea sp. NPDC050536 TaxID=3364366 RepID=UPI0037C9978A